MAGWFSESEQLLLLILTPLAGCGAHAEGVLGRGWPTERSYPWGQRGKQGHAVPYDSENDGLTCSLGVHVVVLCVLGRGGRRVTERAAIPRL